MTVSQRLLVRAYIKGIYMDKKKYIIFFLSKLLEILQDEKLLGEAVEGFQVSPHGSRYISEDLYNTSTFSRLETLQLSCATAEAIYQTILHGNENGMDIYVIDNYNDSIKKTIIPNLVSSIKSDPTRLTFQLKIEEKLNELKTKAYTSTQRYAFWVGGAAVLLVSAAAVVNSFSPSK